MPLNHQRYLLGHTLVGAVVNLVLNAAIGWLAYRELARIPLWGSRSITGDLLATAFLLPFLVCLIVTPLVRAEARHGKTSPLEARGPVRGLLPRGLLARAAVLGLLGAATIGLLTVWALHGSGVRDMSLGQFVGLKAVFSGVLAALITPVVAWRALMDPVSDPDLILRP